MSGMFGVLTLNDTDRVFGSTSGQVIATNLINEYFARVTATINAQLALFVEMETTAHTELYKMPGGGYLSKRAINSSVPNVKAGGQYDVAYPLEEYGAAVGGDYVVMAYMTAGDLERHITTVAIQDANTVRFQILRRIFKSTTDTFVDPLWGSLTIQPLANGDTVTYIPVIGSQTEATENHYLESGYAATAISDANNPYRTIVGELREHFGRTTGGNDIVTFIHSDEQPETEDLTDFDPVVDNFITPGSNRDVPTRLPNVPGEIIGRVSGSWVSVWDELPTGYMYGTSMEAAPPLKMRVDPADTGLGRGLQLVARQAQFPFENAFYSHRFGVGAGNRLNGVVMELGTGGTYTTPTVYA